MLTSEEHKTIMAILEEIAYEMYVREKSVYAISLSAYAIKFRERNGIQAMLDYIRWSKARGETDRILATIGHDLNGMNDELMEPRTLTYLGKNSGS